MRCFVGTQVTPGVVDLARIARETIVTFAPGWQTEKWVPTSNLHVTFAFLGDVDDDQMTRVADGLTGLSVPRFELVSPSLVAIPGGRKAAMCWLEFVDEHGAAARLADEIACVAREAGITIEESRARFRPHVTLVRSRRGRALPQGASQAVSDRPIPGSGVSMSVPSVTLFTSTSTSIGPVYDSVATVMLPGS